MSYIVEKRDATARWSFLHVTRNMRDAVMLAQFAINNDNGPFQRPVRIRVNGTREVVRVYNDRPAIDCEGNPMKETIGLMFARVP